MSPRCGLISNEKHTHPSSRAELCLRKPMIAVSDTRGFLRRVGPRRWRERNGADEGLACLPSALGRSWAEFRLIRFGVTGKPIGRVQGIFEYEEGWLTWRLTRVEGWLYSWERTESCYTPPTWTARDKKYSQEMNDAHMGGHSGGFFFQGRMVLGQAGCSDMMCCTH